MSSGKLAVVLTGNPRNGELIKGELEAAGFRVQVVSSAQDAGEIVAERGGEVSAFIADVDRLPRGSLDVIRKVTGDAVQLVLLATRQTLDRNPHLLHGATHVTPKPLSRQVFRKLLDMLMERRK